jgi:hypothetical protein
LVAVTFVHVCICRKAQENNIAKATWKRTRLAAPRSCCSQPDVAASPEAPSRIVGTYYHWEALPLCQPQPYTIKCDMHVSSRPCEMSAQCLQCRPPWSHTRRRKHGPDRSTDVPRNLQSANAKHTQFTANSSSNQGRNKSVLHKTQQSVLCTTLCTTHFVVHKSVLCVLHITLSSVAS